MAKPIPPLKQEQTMHIQVWQLAWPIMLSNISVPLLGLVDTAILGHLPDPSHLAAVAMGASLFTFVLWSFGFLRMGTTALIAQTYGQHGRDGLELTSVLQSSLLIGGGIGLTIFIFNTWIVQFMIWATDAVQDVSPLAQKYLEIRFYSAPATLINYALLGLFIGMGNTRIPLILLICANTLNALLNYYFVYILKMGSEGVAWGSVIVEYLQVFAALFFAHKIIFHRITFEKLKVHWPKLFNLNINLFIRTIFLLFTLAFFMSQGAQHSAALLSANAILLNLLLFISNALDGFAIAAESLVGRALGEKNKQRIWQAVHISGQWSVLTAILFSGGLWLFHDAILTLLTSQMDVLNILDALDWWLILLPLAGFGSYWLDGIFVGLADGKNMRNSLLVAVLFVFLPLWWCFTFWPYHGLWLAFYGFLLSRALWLLFKLRPAINMACRL